MAYTEGSQEKRLNRNQQRQQRGLQEGRHVHAWFAYRAGRGALVVLRNKAIKPLLAAAQRRRKSRGAQNPRPIDKHYETIRTAMQGVFDELGLAA